MGAETRTLRVEFMGTIGYRPMLALQQQRHSEVLAGADDTMFLLEHHPVITLGKNGVTANVLVSPALLAERGIELVETNRGGDVTFHGPGQVVGYPIVRLDADEQDVGAYVFNLEELIIRTARDFGVVAGRINGLRGVWVGNEKLAAIGVRLSRWTTMHGFALNVNTDLRSFSCIVPCGLKHHGVTSLKRLIGKDIDCHEVMGRIGEHAGAIFRRVVRRMPPTSPPTTTPGEALSVAATVSV